MSLHAFSIDVASRCLLVGRQRSSTHPLLLARRRLYSDKPPSSPTLQNSTAPKALDTTGSAPLDESLGKIVRHGKGDGCIALNVGGKEFHTLRSTVNSNAVLADHVARAEANREILKNGAVFIDRDPEHFGFILKHLRNRMELLTVKKMNASSLPVFTKTFIDIPDGAKTLRELYVEAAFYRIPELQSAISQQSWLSKVMFFFNKNVNPIDSAAKMAARLQATLIALGSIGTAGTAIFLAVKTEWEWLLNKTGLQDEWDWLLKKLGLEKSSSEAASNDSATAPASS